MSTDHPVQASGSGDPRYEGLDDELGRIIVDLARSLARTAELRQGRATHTVGVMAAGSLRVLERPGLPLHPFFKPGARYPITLRHASFKGFMDDAVRDGRSASLRVLSSDERDARGQLEIDKGTFDLVLTSGRAFVLHDARIFHRWFTSNLEQRARILEEYPRFAPNLADFLRSPASFTALDYYSQITYDLFDVKGRRRIVRFRLTGAEDRPDSGFTELSELALPLDYIPRRPGDTRPSSYLRDELRARIAASGVEYRLQIQLRDPPETEEERQEAFDTTRPWPEEAYPHLDLAALRLDELIDDEVAGRQALNVSNMPEGLSLVLARSAGDTASIGHIRSIVYDASAAVRRGKPLPVPLQALFERFGGPLEIGSRPQPLDDIGVSPATRYDGLDDDFQDLVGHLARELRRRIEVMGGTAPRAAAIMARGTMAVRPDPALPENDLFKAGAAYPVSVRHRSDHEYSDDAIADGRVACFRIHANAGELGSSSMDLLLMTGRAHRMPDARRQAAWLLGSRDERLRIARELPDYERNLREFVRDPSSFTELHYHSQLTYHLVDVEGRRHWVRYRLLAADRRPEGGYVDPAALDTALEYIPRRAGDQRPRNYLRAEFGERLARGPVHYVLEVQVRPQAPTDSPEHLAALDCTQPWPEDGYPFRELAVITLDTLVEDALVTRQECSLDVQPATLSLPRARSIEEPASVGHLAAIVNDIGARLQTGRAFDPKLEALVARRASPGATGTSARPAAGPRRVVVIGAGAAGLTVARDLTRLGHRVTVLERSHSIGGKSACFEVDGRAYDLGTHLCTSQYKELRRLAAEVRCPTEVTNQLVNYDIERRAVHVTGESFLNDIGTYMRMLELKRGSFPELGRPGLHHVSHALAEPVGEWLDRHALRPLVRVLGADLGYTSSGYGYLDEPELPALYLLRMIELGGFLDPTQQRTYQGEWTIKGGFMNLWRRVAHELPDVRCGVEVEAVERLEDRVRVRTDAGTFEFDDLVLALPLEQSLGFLDADDEERELFSRIRYNTYYTSVCSVKEMARDGFYIVVQHSQHSRTKGRCTAFHHRYLDSDVYTLYSYLPPGGTPGDVQRILREDVARLGGELEAIHTQKKWEFFPHVLSGDVRAGWFQRMEARQGRRRTVYAGSVLSFELIECTIAHARELVERFYRPVEATAVTAADVAPQRAEPLPAPAPAVDAGKGDGGDLPERSFEEIRAWLVDHVARELKVPPSAIDPHAAVETFSLDSVVANSLLGQFTEWIGFRVTPAVLVEHPTIDAVSRYLAGEDY